MNDFQSPNYGLVVPQPTGEIYQQPHLALPHHEGFTFNVVRPNVKVTSESVLNSDYSKTKDNVRPSVRSIQSDKKLLSQLHTLLEQLKQAKNMLLKNLDSEDADWHREVMKICHIKRQVVGIQQKFSTEYVGEFCQRLKARKKLRFRKQKKRREEYQKNKEAAEKRREKDEAINEVMAAEKNKKEQEEKDAELQKRIDGTLSEVRKKKKDMSQFHNLCRVLRKLRALRQERASTLDSKLDKQKFEKDISRLEEFVQKRSTMYREEEKTMQVMLEGAHNEMKAKEDAEVLRKKAKADKERMKLHIENLFGEDFLQCSSNDQQGLQPFYFQAERDLQSFVNIRQQWDTFLVDRNNPEGSSIPLKWVSPGPPSSEMWACAMEKEKGSNL